MYHRIAEPVNDPWDLCVSPENFEHQLTFLKKNFEVIPMQQFAERLQSKVNLDNCIAITFDDGYLDNYTEAKPILQSAGLPATFYFTTRFHPAQYWWDTLEELILNSFDLPRDFVIEFSSERITFDLYRAQQLTPEIRRQNSEWRYGHPLSNGRIQLYFELWSRIKTMSIPFQSRWIDAIKSTCGINNVSTPALMTIEQLKDLANVDNFEIGAHTLNHPALGSLQEEDQWKEITESKKILDEIVSKKITGFAYPYGHYNEVTPSLVEKAGFSYSVTTAQKLATKDDQVFEIPRFQVKNVNAPVFEKELKLWRRV
jgi:peptidoglycan/xylan/chitin deacetylase (PgdA/CDA1 family)